MRSKLQDRTRCKIDIGDYQFEISIENGEIIAEKIMLDHGNPAELFDRSFHSKLTEEYIRRFFEITKEKLCQWICTTHDLNLMDLRILRQDEIWFVEREKDHSSRIYSLSDYKQRFDKNILNDYLIGRYGAIPCFQDNEWQVDSE